MGAAVRQGGAAQPGGRAGGRAAGSLLLSPARLRAARPPSLPPSPLAAPACPPAPRSPFHLKIFKTLHINICALHNLTRALLIARSLMQPARPIAESSPGGSRAGAARSAPRSGCPPPLRPRPSRLPPGARRRGFAPWLGIFIIWGRGVCVGSAYCWWQRGNQRRDVRGWGGRDGKKWGRRGGEEGEKKGRRGKKEGERRGVEEEAVERGESSRLGMELKGRRSRAETEKRKEGGPGAQTRERAAGRELAEETGGGRFHRCRPQAKKIKKKRKKITPIKRRK